MADMVITSTKGTVTLAEGHVFPRWARVRISSRPDDEHAPFDAVATLEFQGGRMEVTRLDVRQVDGGPPVSGEAIRTLPRAIVRELARRTWNVEPSSDPSAPALMLFVSDPKAVGAAGVSDEALKLTAAAYRFAFVIGDPPSKAVAHHLGIARSTARRWVGLAREKGYLGKAEERRAGELPEED